MKHIPNHIIIVSKISDNTYLWRIDNNFIKISSVSLHRGMACSFAPTNSVLNYLISEIESDRKYITELENKIKSLNTIITNNMIIDKNIVWDSYNAPNII